MIDTSVWTRSPITYGWVAVGDRLVHEEADTVETVTEVTVNSDALDSYAHIRTDGPLLGGTYYATDQGTVLAPPEPVEGVTLARQPAGFHSGLTSCTCLYRRNTMDRPWFRISVDPVMQPCAGPADPEAAPCPSVPSRPRQQSPRRWAGSRPSRHGGPARLR